MSAADTATGITGGAKSPHDVAGLACGTGPAFGPQRVKTTLEADNTPSTPIDAAASAKKFAAVALCVDSHQPPNAMNVSRAHRARTRPTTLAAPCGEKYSDNASPMNAYNGETGA